MQAKKKYSRAYPPPGSEREACLDMEICFKCKRKYKKCNCKGDGEGYYGGYYKNK